MKRLNLPEYSFKIKLSDQKKLIFDPIRKRYVVLTPEEWVRQNLISYLIQERGYPPSLIAVEMALKVYGNERRADIVLFDRSGLPYMIVECKAPGVKITQQAFDQAANYNIGFKVSYLLVSNGVTHYCARLYHDSSTWELLKEIPMFPIDSDLSSEA